MAAVVLPREAIVFVVRGLALPAAVVLVFDALLLEVRVLGKAPVLGVAMI